MLSLYLRLPPVTIYQWSTCKSLLSLGRMHLVGIPPPPSQYLLVKLRIELQKPESVRKERSISLIPHQLRTDLNCHAVTAGEKKGCLEWIVMLGL